MQSGAIVGSSIALMVPADLAGVCRGWGRSGRAGRKTTNARGDHADSGTDRVGAVLAGIPGMKAASKLVLTRDAYTELLESPGLLGRLITGVETTDV